MSEPATNPAPTTDESKKNKNKIIIGCAVAAGVVVLSIALGMICNSSEEEESTKEGEEKLVASAALFDKSFVSDKPTSSDIVKFASSQAM